MWGRQRFRSYHWKADIPFSAHIPTVNHPTADGRFQDCQIAKLMATIGVGSGRSASETECGESSRRFGSALITVYDPNYRCSTCQMLASAFGIKRKWISRTDFRFVRVQFARDDLVVLQVLMWSASNFSATKRGSFLSNSD